MPRVRWSKASSKRYAFNCFGMLRQVTLVEHGELELSPGFTESLLQGIDHMQQVKEQRERERQQRLEMAEQKRATRKLTKEEKLAQQVLRMYKSWDSMRGVATKHEGFFPPELEYLREKNKRPAVEHRIKEKCQFCMWLHS